MMFLVVFSLVASLGWFGANVAGDYGPRFDYHALNRLEEAIHRVAGEATFLTERIAMVDTQKKELDGAFDGVRDHALTDLAAKNSNQSTKIRSIKDTLKAYYHQVGALEERLATVMAVSQRTKSRVSFLQDQVQALQLSNVHQDASVEDVGVTLNLTRTKLNEKLATNVAERQEAVEAIEVDVDQFQVKIATRRCFVDTVELMMDEMTAQGSADVPFPASYFSGNMPTVQCGMQGLVSKLDPHRSRGYGSYGYGNRDRTAVTVDCKAFEDKVTVKAFDQSTLGERYDKENRFLYVYVEVRACSFAAQSGF